MVLPLSFVAPYFLVFRSSVSGFFSFFFQFTCNSCSTFLTSVLIFLRFLNRHKDADSCQNATQNHHGCNQNYDSFFNAVCLFLTFNGNGNSSSIPSGIFWNPFASGAPIAPDFPVPVLPCFRQIPALLLPLLYKLLIPSYSYNCQSDPSGNRNS